MTEVVQWLGKQARLTKNLLSASPWPNVTQIFQTTYTPVRQQPLPSTSMESPSATPPESPQDDPIPAAPATMRQSSHPPRLDRGRRASLLALVAGIPGE